MERFTYESILKKQLIESVGFSGTPKDMEPLGPHTIPIPLP